VVVNLLCAKSADTVMIDAELLALSVTHLQQQQEKDKKKKKLSTLTWAGVTARRDCAMERQDKSLKNIRTEPWGRMVAVPKGRTEFCLPVQTQAPLNPLPLHSIHRAQIDERLSNLSGSTKI
jgi:hypothetical protein